MAIKPFEQIYPGLNAANLKPKKDISPQEWERKQRLKEYRIAARREKRNRKSDEKKQRKLNATILRRMTRNPEKYTKNAGRNRLRAIEAERRKIQTSAVHMAQRLAAVYDPSGAMFNVSPVVTLEDGRVTTVEALQKRKEREAQKAAEKRGEVEAEPSHDVQTNGVHTPSKAALQHGNMNSDRMEMIESQLSQTPTLSKRQQKKQAEFAPRPALPKPIIPEGIEIPSDEEENWLALWDLDDGELERRVLRAKKRAARERKEFRQYQKSGKAERRAARDEKRRVYREIKQSWQVIRQEERRRRQFLTSMEDEERKRLAVQVNVKNRKDALDAAAALGFTLENVEGVDEITPKTQAMKGLNIDFNKLEYDGDGPSGLKIIDEKAKEKPRGNRVDLGAVPEESHTSPVFAQKHASGPNASALGQQDFVGFGADALQGHEAQVVNYNHKVRRKLRRAMEGAKIRREMLVRSKAIEHCEQHGLEVPAALKTPDKPISIRGQRTLPSGLLETAKQERTRAKVELTEFNKQARVLRKQAKEMAVEAGIRVYLELMGRIPKREGLDEEMAARQAERDGHNGPAAVEQMTSMADLIASWPMPEEGLGQLEGAFEEDDYAAFGGEVEVAAEEDEEEGLDTSEDSAARQLRREMAREVRQDGGGSSEDGSESSGSDDDSDEDMSDVS
ncbi:hypothetical protein EPUS_06895 [Endocarpon pusillum Z07020]|uniref:Uncharacterized protein n=1 Tax=Endocarpon pusillum (strain Z07020 / HMAS-L-300199) TaxID=1263415 RepID=U1HGX0_ENDPU|nr:uncharacterized protein EPUS_06895 [Endocarpon pusillum Z07020]ERF68084.1 hypothetical protein EPUS_06895 [Endocarpon pusillum Z07020]